MASADALSDKLDATMIMLGRRPQAGRLREEFGVGVRSFPSGSYIIVYREVKPGVEGLRVLHAARDIESMFEE
jgi:toxin ParE1/3/4